jgi:hypothetical protein
MAPLCQPLIRRGSGRWLALEDVRPARSATRSKEFKEYEEYEEYKEKRQEDFACDS